MNPKRQKRTYGRMKENIKALNKEQVEKFLQGIPVYRHKLIIKVLLNTGMRVGELHALRVEWIKRKEGLIDLPAQATKTKSRREVRIDKGLLNEILDYCQRNKSQRFVGCSVRNIQKFVKRYGERILGVDWLTPHKLRHTHITIALLDGIPKSVVQEQVGHVDSRTTDIYTHISGVEQVKAYEASKFSLGVYE